MRRDKNDKEWALVKKQLDARDGEVCRLSKVISVAEMFSLRKNAGSRLSILDPAHIYPVSLNATIMYELDNLVKLNRFSHEMLDNMKHPISGKPISKDSVYLWWEKIAGKVQWAAIYKLLRESKHGR